MDLVSFMRNHAQEVGGQFSEYDDSKSIIVLPLVQGRFQTIIGCIKDSNVSSKQIIEISSKICQYKESLNLVELLKENTNLTYAKFSIVDDYLKVEASASTANISPDVIKEMIHEVADVADQWEQRFTGIDVH